MKRYIFLTSLVWAALCGEATAAIPSRQFFGQSLAQFNASATTNVADGYRPICLDANGSTNSPNIAVVWIKDGFTDWTNVLQLTSSQYTNQSVTLSNAGYRPLCLDAYGVYPNERYMAVWVKDQVATNGWAQAFTLSQSDFSTALNTNTGAGLRPIWISVLASNSTPVFSSVWAKDGYNHYTYWNKTASSLSQSDTNIAPVGYRMVSLTGYLPSGATNFSANWVLGVQGRFTNLVDQTAPAFGSVVTSLTGNGYRPLSVSEYGSTASPLYASTWIQDPEWQFTGDTSPDLAALDTAMTNYMAARNTSRAQLAVTKDGKLVFSRAYTYAPTGSTPTQSTNLFRIASLSKQFTGVGILQLVEANRLNLTNTIGQLLGVTNLVDSRFTNVTVLQLLQHTGGWDSSKSGGYDPMYVSDSKIAIALGVGLPITRQMIIDYMETQPLDFTNGAKYVYSNFGYCLLGRIIEAVTGTSYENFIRTNILDVLGVSDMQLGETLLSNALPAEVYYEDLVGVLANSVMGTNGPSPVPWAYGGFNLNNMDSHGGWVATAQDLVRFSSAFTWQTNSPLLSSNSIFLMINRPSFKSATSTSWYGGGWLVLLNNTNNPLNLTNVDLQHDGSLPGTYANAHRRKDGICWAAVLNRRTQDMTSLSSLADLNLDSEIEAAINSITNWPDVDYFASVVTNLADSGPGSLRDAIALAPNSTITFAPNLSGQTMNLTSGELILTNDLTIDASALPGGITIDGQGLSRLLSVGSGRNVTVRGLTLTGGNGTGATGSGNGGAVFNQGNLTLERCTLAGNSGNVGGAVRNSTGELIVNQCTVSGNTSTNSGPGIANLGGTLRITHSTLSLNNTSSGAGGGIYNSGGTVTLTNCIVAANSAFAGDDIYNQGGMVAHRGANIIQSLVNVSSGTDVGPAVINAAPLLNPLGDYGGPTQTMPPSLDSPALDAGSDSAAAGFATDQRGYARIRSTHVDIGAVELQNPFPIVTTTADSGAGSLREQVDGADASSLLTFDPALSGQTITLTSGQLKLTNGLQLVIDASTLPAGITIDGNHASRVFNVPAGAHLSMNALTLRNGYAAGANGGGIRNDGQVTLNACTLAGNQADLAGGGIFNSGGTLILNQCTLAENEASTSGGAIALGSGATAAVTQCTLSQNSAGSLGGGIHNNGGTLAVTNSIVAGNTQSSGANINGAFTGSSNLTGGNPLLSTLGNYGGPTPTMPPQPGSPAIDAGSDSAASGFAADQRGFARIRGDQVDIGAVELQTPFLVVLNTTDNSNGSLRQRVNQADVNSLITFTNTLSGQTITLTSGQITLTNNVYIDASSLPQSPRISGNNSSRVFEVPPGVTASLTRLIIRDGLVSGSGTSGRGAGILNQGTLQLTKCTLTDNAAANGGGLGNDGGVATVTACTFATNSATSAGGAVTSLSSGSVTILQSTFAGNSADSTGGGAVNSTSGNTSLFLDSCTIVGNSATGGSASGGGVRQVGGTVTITNCIVAGNTAGVGGTEDISGTLVLTGPKLIGVDPQLAPLGDYGGPTQTMPPLPGSPAIDGAIVGTSFAADQRGLPRVVGAFADLGATESGNAIPGVNYTLVTTGNDFLTEFDDNGISLRSAVNFAAPGATITFDPALSGHNITLTKGQLTLTSHHTIDASNLPESIGISGNNSSRVFEVLPGVTASLTGLTIWRGYAPNGSYPANSGGGILNQGTLTLLNCVVLNNQAVQAGDSGGGGIENNNGTLTIHNSTISSNSASRFGGGIDSYNSTALTINESTVTGNSSGFAGGGIYSGNSTLTLNQSTVTANSASTQGGGIYNSSNLNLYNSIVAENSATTGSDLYNTGTLTPAGVNLTNGAPLLAPLGNYGGPTPTMPPMPGSPAINGCTNGTTFVLDQRGLPRVVGAFADLGAVEGVYNPAMSLVNPIQLADGSFRFFFNNLSGLDYTVLASPNLTLPLNLWSNLGLAAEVPAGSGQFRFTDLQVTNYPRRFYRVQGP